jgi:hypothetical protein
MKKFKFVILESSCKSIWVGANTQEVRSVGEMEKESVVEVVKELADREGLDEDYYKGWFGDGSEDDYPFVFDELIEEYVRDEEEEKLIGEGGWEYDVMLEEELVVLIKEIK